jgi:uncharacterized protein (TIGR00661 family)
MGHAMRSRVVLSHLLAEGHEVTVMASQRAVDYLRRWFSDVRRIHGFCIITEANRVRRGKTLYRNVEEGLAALPGQVRAYFELVREFEPECVISDFESWTYLYGKSRRLPVLSLDNIQMIHRCRHPEEFIAADPKAFRVAKAFVKAKLPGCDHYFVTTFFDAEVRKKRTTLHPPILRPEILAATPSKGEHLLVYQTAEGNLALADALTQAGLPCRVYGMRRNLEADVVEGNLTYRPFSEAGFIEDLATSRAVVAGGGFTLMSEAVYMHKPMLSTPIVGQFEQTLNGLYLERMGYGRRAPAVTAETLSAFLDAVPGCESALSSYEQDGNRELLAALDAALDRVTAGLPVDG